MGWLLAVVSHAEDGATFGVQPEDEGGIFGSDMVGYGSLGCLQKMQKNKLSTHRSTGGCYTVLCKRRAQYSMKEKKLERCEG